MAASLRRFPGLPGAPGRLCWSDALLPARNPAMRTAWIAAALLAAPPGLLAQGLDYVKAHYTKYEYRVPMRDGKKLFTAVYVPKDDSETYPILLMRTPYSVG